MTNAINNLTTAEAEKIITTAYNDNKDLFNKARDLQNNLGLGYAGLIGSIGIPVICLFNKIKIEQKITL